MTTTPDPIAVTLGDARSLPWPSGSVATIVTSPPYWGQRDYEFPSQIGSNSRGRV